MARLEIKLESIAANARLVAGELAPLGVRLVGVTKACLGDEKVAEAMLSGGARALADSRLANINRLRRSFPEVELELLRPPLGEDIPAGAADSFLVSSAEQARLLLAASAGTHMRVLLMLETGDGREGAPLQMAAEEAGRLCSLPGAELAGVATNTACSRPEANGAAALAMLASAAEAVSRRRQQVSAAGAGGANNAISRAEELPPMTISAGGSGLLAHGSEASNAGPDWNIINELRCGEALLLGRIPSGGAEPLFLEGGFRDAFRLVGTVLEIYEKEGSRQALLDFGLQDVGTAPLEPSKAGVRVTSLTSDYLAVAIDPSAYEGGGPRIGEDLAFLPSYYALAAAMATPFISKFYV